MFKQLRRRFACWISPEVGEMVSLYKVMLDDVRDFRDFIGKDIPEVKMTCQWILGKNSSLILDRKENPAGIVSPSYKTFKDYPSLTHFRDILVNDYKRKVRMKNEK
jgi:hypothetical protein